MGNGGRGQFPHNSLTWSPVQRPPAGHFNTNYCLLIQVTLTDELGDVPPPMHSSTTLVMEDMLWETRARLTEAVVVGPGKAILFYGRHSLGEGLKADEARDAAFLLTGAGTWVGKSAYLTADPMMLQEGKRAITHAVSSQRTRVSSGKSAGPTAFQVYHIKGLSARRLVHAQSP